VGLGDRLDDRQTETAAFGGRLLCLAEPLESMRKEVGGEPFPFVGHVELDTFGVISSTNPKFTEAVQRALPDWAYAPAMKDGKRVRQLVQQPFTFVVDSSVMKRASSRQ